MDASSSDHLQRILIPNRNYQKVHPTATNSYIVSGAKNKTRQNYSTLRKQFNPVINLIIGKHGTKVVSNETKRVQSGNALQESRPAAGKERLP